MEKIINTQPIETFIKEIPTIKQSLDDVSNSMGNYLTHLEKSQFKAKEGETHKEKYTRLESTLDVVKETIEKRDALSEKGKETITTLKKIIQTIENITQEGENKEETFKKAHNELIDEILKARKEEMEEKIAPLKREIKAILEDYEKKKEEFDKDRRKENDEEKTKRLEKEYEEEKRIMEEKIERKKKEFEEKWMKVEEENQVGLFIDKKDRKSTRLNSSH